MVVQEDKHTAGLVLKKPDSLDRIRIALLAAAAKRDARPPLCANPLRRLIGRFAVNDREPVFVANLLARCGRY
jgi:hypothetical protein